jgi:tagatose 6-phosphate kinase
VIIAVCLNPAVDVTYSVDTLRPGASHRVAAAHRLPGGKGVNVARVLAQLGEPVTLCGFAGGDTGRWLRSSLTGSGVTDRLTGIEAPTRQTLTVVDDTDATVFNEPGPPLTSADWARLIETFDELATGADLAVLSGSVPPGAPGDAYALLVRRARHHKIMTVVDAAGSQLRAAAEAGPTVLAPNRAEVDLPTGSASELLAAAERLSRRSGSTVVISAGRDGLVAVENRWEAGDLPAPVPAPGGPLADGGSGARRGWTARPPRQVAGNPTGAGDALTAGIARGLVRGTPFPSVLADALALAAAAVAEPVAGRIDESLYRDLTSSSTVQEVAPCP